MSNNNNIEDIFKNAFHDSREEPSQKVWNNLNKKLFVKNITQKFANYKVVPSEKIWIAISRKLLWKQFLRFSLVKFNVYYASFISLLAVLGIFYFNSGNSTNNCDIKYLNSQNHINNVINNSINYIAYVDNNKKNTDNIETKELQNIAENNNLNESYNKKSNKNYLNNEVQIQTENVNKNINKNINKKITYLQENKTNKFEDKTPDNVLVDNPQNINKTTSLNLSNTKNNINIDNPEVLRNNIVNNSSGINSKSSSEFNVSFVKSIDAKQVSNDKLFLLNKLLASNLYNPVDSFYNIYNPDTVGIDAFGDIITIDKSQIFVDVFASAQLNKYNFTSHSNDNTYSKLISDATKGKESFGYGVRLSYFYKNYLFQTGVGITNFTEKINYDYYTQKINTSDFYTYFNTTHTVYDTIQIVNLDSLLASGDTVYSQYIKQNTITVLDSSLQTKTDTTKIKQNLNNKNVYTYVEIPAIIGYRINNNKLSYNLSGGVIIGLFIKDKGYIISQNNINDIQKLNKSLPYIKPNISAVIKLGITYKLTDKISVLVEPFYRRNINSWLDKSSIYDKRNSAYGITFGTRIFIK